MAVSVAVVGATGAVGDLIRKVLFERGFPVKAIKFLASERSVGNSIEFGGKRYVVEPIRPEAFAGVQIVLSSTPGKISQEFSPIAAKQGAIVVDNSSAWRMDPDVPLVVPEVNADELKNINKGHRRQSELRGDSDLSLPSSRCTTSPKFAASSCRPISRPQAKARRACRISSSSSARG